MEITIGNSFVVTSALTRCRWGGVHSSRMRMELLEGTTERGGTDGWTACGKARGVAAGPQSTAGRSRNHTREAPLLKHSRRDLHCVIHLQKASFGV